MKLGQKLTQTISDDEILERVGQLWAQQTGKGITPGADLYAAILGRITQLYVQEKRDGATLMVRKFAERNPYEFIKPLLQQYSQSPETAGDGPRSLSRNATPDKASRAVVDKAKSEQRKTRRLILGTASLLTSLLVAREALDKVHYDVDWADIPTMISSTLPLNSEPPISANTWLPSTSWMATGYQERRTNRDEQVWQLTARNQNCESAIASESASKEQAERQSIARSAELAALLGIDLADAPTLQHKTVMVGRYPATVVTVVHPLVQQEGQEWQRHFSYAYAVIPEGLAATGVAYAAVTTDLDTEVLQQKASRALASSIAGTAIGCKNPTIWGWYMERARYVTR